jgi:uncharacterized membrane protein
MSSPPLARRPRPAGTTRRDVDGRFSAATRLAQFAGVLFSGLFAGFLVTVLVLENSLRSFDGADYTQVRQAELDGLDRLAAATLIPAMIATVVLVFLGFRTRSRTRWLALAALALMVTIFVVTLTINLPINSDQLDWSTDAPPADWADVRDTWQIAHAIRTVAAVVAFGLLATAAAIWPVVPGQTEGARLRKDAGSSPAVP